MRNDAEPCGMLKVSQFTDKMKVLCYPATCSEHWSCPCCPALHCGCPHLLPQGNEDEEVVCLDWSCPKHPPLRFLRSPSQWPMGICNNSYYRRKRQHRLRHAVANSSWSRESALIDAQGHVSSKMGGFSVDQHFSCLSLLCLSASLFNFAPLYVCRKLCCDSKWFSRKTRHFLRETLVVLSLLVSPE